ncbi:hypothetical protein [Streptomyces sp. NPDC055189]
MGRWSADLPDDVLAAVDLFDENTSAPKGEEPRPAFTRASGAQLGNPLMYALPPGPGDTDRSPRELLLCFPFDLEELPCGRRYRQAELTAVLDDGLRALVLHPTSAPPTPSMPPAPHDVAVRAFGLGGSRLRWVFQAPDGSGELRPDGRWAQALVRLPPGTVQVSGLIGLSTVIERPKLFGVWPRTPARLPQDVPFRLAVEDAWTTAGTLAGHGTLPGAWALPPYEEGNIGDAGAARGPMRDSGAGEDLPPGLRRLCLAVDIEKYSARDNADMVRLQRVLLRTLRAACAHAGVRWEACGRQAQGDGYLLVMAPGVDETRVVPALLVGLADGLAAANGALPDPPPDHVPEEPVSRAAENGAPRLLRMRASLHQGIVHEADSGWAGSAVVALFRVLDSGPLRKALASDTSAVLAVAFSDGLYQDLVANGYAGLSPDGFHHVDVHNAAKGFSASAWIRLGPGI